MRRWIAFVLVCAMLTQNVGTVWAVIWNPAEDGRPLLGFRLTTLPMNLSDSDGPFFSPLLEVYGNLASEDDRDEDPGFYDDEGDHSPGGFTPSPGSEQSFVNGRSPGSLSYGGLTEGSSAPPSPLRSPSGLAPRHYLHLGQKLLLKGRDESQGLSVLWTQEKSASGDHFRLHLEGSLQRRHHLIVDGDLLLSLAGLNLMSLQSNTPETTFLGKTWVETVSLEQGQGKIAPDASLTFRDLWLGQDIGSPVMMEVHGKVFSLENGQVDLSSQSRITLKPGSHWQFSGPQTWYGSRSLNCVIEEDAMLENSAPWTVRDLGIKNQGLLNLTQWTGSLSSLENEGTVSAKEFKQLKIKKFQNAGTVWGAGEILFAGKNTNAGNFLSLSETSGLKLSADPGIQKCLFLNTGQTSIEEMSDRALFLQNQGNFKIKRVTLGEHDLQSSGTFEVDTLQCLDRDLVNEGTLVVRELLAQKFVNKGKASIDIPRITKTKNSGTIFVRNPFPDGGVCRGKGTYHLLCPLNVSVFPGFLKRGRWHVDHLYLSGTAPVLLDPQDLSINTLTVNQTVVTKGCLKISELKGAGHTIINDGKLTVQKIHVHSLRNQGEAHLATQEIAETENSGTVFVEQIEGLGRLSGEGCFHVKSVSSSRLLESLKRGRWHVGEMTLGDAGQGDSVVLDAQDLTIDRLISLASLHNTGTLKLEALEAPQKDIHNGGLLLCVQKLQCRHIHNERNLIGSGAWQCGDFLNKGTFETHATHQIAGGIFTNDGTMCGVDAESLFTFRGAGWVCGIPPPNTPQRARTTPSSPWTGGLEKAERRNPEFHPPALPVLTAPPVHAKFHSQGKVGIHTHGTVDSRWGEMFASAGLEVTTEAGEILVGAYVPGPMRSATSISHPAHNVNGYTFSHPITYQGGQRNGGFLASGEELLLGAPLGAIRSVYGGLMGKRLVFRTPQLHLIATACMGQEGLFEAPLIRITRDQLYWSPYNGYVEAPCGGRWKWHRTQMHGTSPHDRSEASTVQVTGPLTLKGVTDGLVEGSSVLAGGLLQVNGADYTGATPTFRVEPTKAQQAAPSVVGGRQGVSVTTDLFALSQSRLGGLTLDIDVKNLIAHSGRRQESGTLQLSGALNLYDLASQAFQGLTEQDASGTLRLTIPLGDGTPLPQVAWLGHPERTLRLDPHLLRMLMPHLVDYLGLDALEPEILEELAERGREIAQASRPALEGRRSQTSSRTDMSLALALPLTLDLQRVSHDFGSFVFQKGRDLWFQPSPTPKDPLVAGAETSGRAVLYGEKHMHATVQNHTDFVGPLVASKGEERDAFRILSGTLTDPAATHTETHATSGGTHTREVLDHRPVFLAPEGGGVIETRAQHGHFGAVFATQEGTSLHSREDHLLLGVQELHEEISTQTTRRERGFLNKKTTRETHTEHRTHAIPCTVVSAGRDVTQGKKGVTCVGTQIQDKTWDPDGGDGNVLVLPAQSTVTVTDTFEKKGAFCRSSGSETRVTHQLDPARIQTGSSHPKGEAMEMRGADLRVEDILKDDTRKGTSLRTAKAENTITRHHTSSKPLRKREVEQEGGVETLLPPQVQVGTWQSASADSDKKLLMEGVRGKIEKLELQNTAPTVQDATQRVWGRERATTSGLQGGPFKAEPLATALRNLKGGAHPLLQAIAVADLTHVGVGTLQDIAEIGRTVQAGAGTLSTGVNIGEILLKRYGTATFGKSQTTRTFEQNTAVPSKLHIDEARIINDTFVQLQGDVSGRKWYVRTDQVMGLPSASTSQQTQTSQSRTVGVNPVALSVSVGSHKLSNFALRSSIP